MSIITLLSDFGSFYPAQMKAVILRIIGTIHLAGGIEPLITLGSHGFVEVAVNRGSAAKLFGLAIGDTVVLEDVDL